MSEQLLTSSADGVCEMRFNRPEKRNAITFAMYEALYRGLTEAQADEAVRVVLLSGEGAAFCAGNDLNDFLSGLFLGLGIKLVDFKCEFGRLWENETMRIVLADEISPDCSRLWDIETQNKLDKDRFRRDMGGLVEAYQEVARRLGLHVDSAVRARTGPVLVRSK